MRRKKHITELLKRIYCFSFLYIRFTISVELLSIYTMYNTSFNMLNQSYQNFV